MTDEEIDAALSLVNTGSPREQLEYRYSGFNLLTIMIRLRQYDQAKRLLDNGFHGSCSPAVRASKATTRRT